MPRVEVRTRDGDTNRLVFGKLLEDPTVLLDTHDESEFSFVGETDWREADVHRLANS